MFNLLRAGPHSKLLWLRSDYTLDPNVPPLLNRTIFADGSA